ncbi:UDP-N-acetylmuramoyl-L-alanyl-D-glutamate--2,6-diaminopimelate ligase [Pedobacter yulinensis]|uniref:UDP-N-acetylmuramoyl-L-alanyl-D-glutamate--2,6-diaminopimelate ligase n=1 Tax=Pedobacter yulinensis TaxID=2126353 RepID=A0A2T3HHL4_9SPHI|nr:UDP-N-acetylmuramoyl-L-alanyl-D-glutamate--2,6-diaminopimelate ligase [Pedobacter yulinensis]PST81893.1 UDP-N-acetylmuramoyl-L-alanyl-D-glutamate--2,6-diaminopimelate ligase [Pedobacter yulinensis]
MQLKEILYGVQLLEVSGSTEKEIHSLCSDSRKAAPGGIFIAIKGTLSDGHAFISQTIAAGITAVVCAQFPASLQAEVTYIRVPEPAAALGIMASNFYGQPSSALKLVGVTGTNGKTTIATLLFRLFRDMGYKAGLLSTVENYVNDRVVPATHTTPDPLALNLLLREMVDAGCDYCFMEVSSHAVAQHRISGLSFSGGVFSNLTHDHLDFHKTFDQYLGAKKAFFDALPKSAFALTNLDDRNGVVMLQNTRAHKKTYALKQLADFKGKILDNQFTGLHMEVDQEDVYFRLVGSFNAYNIMAVYGTAILLEQDKLGVLTALSRLQGAEGRFDYTVSAAGVIGIVDYAHTPDAVQNVLSTIQNIRKGTEQVITVIGCGGDRDKTKRPVMAQVACDWSDKVILTSDNPRSEDPQAILDDMQTGVTPSNSRKVLVISDRKEAIKTAFHLAGKGDIILVAGKGHEKYQEINGVRKHFDDKEILTELFNQAS